MQDDKFTKGIRGEFRGDFTRDTFDPLRHFSRVLMQQGRVQLDADWNEQISIHLNYFRKLGADLMGPHGAPRDTDGNEGEGFKINTTLPFKIGYGHYYVNGILCENNDENLTYDTQPDNPLKDGEDTSLSAGENYLVYLDVWERHLSYVEDDYMREKALGGTDTATRAKIVWQVKVKEMKRMNSSQKQKLKSSYATFLTILANEKKPGSGQLKARARKIPEDIKDPCLTSPEAKYRGAENQLYRVEIHDGTKNGSAPTFKWSRENGSVIFSIAEINGEKITLENLGRDSRFGLKPNDWVEIIDDDYVLQNRVSKLLKVTEVDNENMQVTLSEEPEFTVKSDTKKHPYLRRWEGTADVILSNDDNEKWIDLEDGVQIQFPKLNEDQEYIFQTGDYWLIPARTATGDVEWPGSVDHPDELPPQGVEHHYAPLCYISIKADGSVGTSVDLRRKLKENWE